MKNKLSKGLSLSANPKCLIKGIFSAATDVFASFFRKNYILKNNKHSTKLAGGTTQAILAPVINGPVPRILLQQGTNLVNKLALLLHKCRFAQDSRDKPENDGSWRCWLSICYKLFKYPSPADKSATSPARGEVTGLLRCARNDSIKKYVIRGLIPANLDCRIRLCVTSGNDSKVECGRSMIEMLGVLAIIAVLSVGGIAGYSKAMEKFKLNKAMDEYSYLIYGLLEHLDEIKYSTKSRDGNDTPVVELANNLNLVPPTWTMIANNLNVSHKNLFEDPYNNLLSIYSKNGNLRFDFILGGSQFKDEGSWITENFSTKFCMELVNNVVKPLHSSLEFLLFYRSKGNSSTFYGDKNCSSGRKCLSDISIKEVYDNCKRCSKKEVCSVTIDF